MASIQFQESGNRVLPHHRRKQLVVNIVDGLANVKPHAPYAYFPVSPDNFHEGFRKLSYREFANAINGLAWWLTSQLGRSDSSETLTYVGPNDFRHNALILACAKAGYTLLLASPRNQCAAFKYLLEHVKCKAVLVADRQSEVATRIHGVYPAPFYEIPSTKILLAEPFPFYPYDKTFEEAKDIPLLTLHSSGTTGTPKPLTYTNDFVAAYMQASQAEPPDGSETKDQCMCGTRVFVMLPPFHAAYIFLTFCIPLANETTLVLPPANLPPSVSTLIEGIQSISVDTAAVPPIFASTIASNEHYLDVIAQRIDTLVVGGAKTVEADADVIATRTKLINVYGATEIGICPDIIPRKRTNWNSWHYIQPHPLAGWEFRPHEPAKANGVYEAWIVRSSHEETVQPVFKMFPDRKEYLTRDLFQPHPSHPGFWKWCGRMDETIVLVSAGNVSPIAMESGLSEHPLVQGVLMLGNHRVRPFLIIQPKDASVAPADFLDTIWETVDELNASYFGDHRVLKTHILVTCEDKPIMRSPKGSILRHATVDLYKDEIDKIFNESS